MSARWNVAALLEPITPDEPCGQSLEDTGELAQLDAFQIFGQDTLLPPELEKGAPVPKEKAKAKSDRPPNWNELGDLAFGQLRKSKDIRILTHLSAAVLWTEGEGLRSFVETLSVASKWLADYWPKVYPLVEDDAILRRNALNGFADRAAIIEGLRRAPMIENRKHGRIDLRDLEAGAAPVAGSEAAAPDAARIDAAFAEMPIADLQALLASTVEGLAALKSIDEACRSAAGIEAAPSFEPVVAQIQRVEAALRARVSLHPDGVPQADQAVEGTSGGVVGVGAIRSRQDAIRALDAASEFFRRHEPSSPVPLIVDRAKRLIAKDFLEVIADIAPEALGSARAAGGIRD